MQEVNIRTNELIPYQCNNVLPEYGAWLDGTLKLMGYSECTLRDYIQMQDTVLCRLNKPKKAKVKLRMIHYNNFVLN